MSKFCQLCAKEKNLEIHHVSYKKNLTIKVCKSCHMEIEELQKKIKVKKEIKVPMALNCKNCEHSWTYMGKNPYYVTCPRCYNKVRVEK